VKLLYSCLLFLASCSPDYDTQVLGVWHEVTPHPRKVYVEGIPPDRSRKTLEIKPGSITLTQTCDAGGVFLSAWQDSALAFNETSLLIQSSMMPAKLGCRGEMQSGEWKYWILEDKLYLEGPYSVRLDFERAHD
jgi:hypothetical protein